MVDASDPYRIDKTRLRQRFDRAAERYDEAAVLQHEVAGRMLERLELIKIDPRVILDVGCGTGRGTAALMARYRKARVLALDLAPGMLRQTRRRLRWRRRLSVVCADAERLPLADARVDLLYSNLTLQWCNDVDAVFAGFRRVMRAGGALMFSTFGPDTLKELRACWEQVDGHTHVNSFIDMHDIGDALLRAGFADPVVDMEMITVTYRDARTLMQDLKCIGAANVTAGRARGLTGRARMQAVEQAYERFRNAQGLLPATYEIVYGHAWAPEAPPPSAPGRSIPIRLIKP